jgi:glutamyl-tRNA synthetase
MTILSPAYEERQDVHPDISLRDYSFDISSLNNSGALVDLDKMEQVHRSYLSRLSQDDLYNAARDRSAQYHESLHTLLIEQPEYMREALNIQRHTDQDPKRYVLISDVYDVIKLFDDAYRSDHIGGASWPESFTHKEIATLLYEYAGYVSLD